MIRRPPTSTLFPYTTSSDLVDKDETKKRFYSIKPDIEYLSRVVYDWLLKNGRMASPKYITGESYRSEEHTSELQSHSDLVCRLLLEKKKNSNNYYTVDNITI